jgi:hypothetical protein
MPYIDRQARERIAALGSPVTMGELTYVLFKTVKDYANRHGEGTYVFQDLGEVVAALEQAKDEFQRTVIHPYEERKRRENGDV